MPTTTSDKVRIIGNLTVWTQTTTGGGPPVTEAFYETDGNLTQAGIVAELTAAKQQRQREIATIDAALGAKQLRGSKRAGRGGGRA